MRSVVNQREGHERHEGGSAHAHEAGQRGPTARPLHRALRPADRPRLDRLTAQEAAQIFGQRLRADITTPRILLQTFQADRFEIARQLGLRREGGTGSSPSTSNTVSSGVGALKGARPVSTS